MLGRSFAVLGHSINQLGIATGANLLDIAKIGIDEGLLNSNETLIADAYAQIHTELVIENEIMVDGIRADGSFGQHGGVLYNGKYGKDLYVSGSTVFQKAGALTIHATQHERCPSARDRCRRNTIRC